MIKENETLTDKLSEYIKVVEDLRSNYPTQVIINNPVEKVFLYRGHGNVEYKLLPSVFRKVEEPQEDRVIVNDKYLAFAKEKDILKTFIHDAKRDWNIDPVDYFHWAEIAQHYGVPTRFLDWTQNPLVALYFAASSNEDKDGEVWILHGVNYDRVCAKEHGVENELNRGEIITKVMDDEIEVKFPILYTPYYIDDRMKAQDSYFLVWGTEIVPLENMFDEENSIMKLPGDDNARTFGLEQRDGILFRIVIPKYAKQQLLRELDMVGISARTLFPDMSGLGKYIEWKYRFNYPEALQQF